MTMVRGQFAQLMAPGLHDEFLHWVDLLQRDEEYSHIFHVETSKMAYEDEVEFSGLPPLVEKPEGEAISYSDAVQGGNGFTFCLFHQRWKAREQIGREHV